MCRPPLPWSVSWCPTSIAIAPGATRPCGAGARSGAYDKAIHAASGKYEAMVLAWIDPRFQELVSKQLAERHPQLGVETGLIALDGTFEVMS